MRGQETRWHNWNGKECLRWRSILLVGRLCRVLGSRLLRRPVEYLDIELPPFEMFASLLARDDNYQFRDLAARHPFVELGHDLLDVCFDLIIGSDKHIESILLDTGLGNQKICMEVLDYSHTL